MTVLFDSSFLALHWDEADRSIWAEWKGTPSGDPMKQAFEVALKLITEKGVHKWLADTGNIGTMDPADVKWVNDDWVPRAAAAGIRWMAFVAPKKIVMQLAVRSFISRIDDRELANGYFDSLEAAREWLTAQT
jgi:hypothetical protein